MQLLLSGTMLPVSVELEHEIHLCSAKLSVNHGMPFSNIVLLTSFFIHSYKFMSKWLILEKAAAPLHSGI